MRGKTKALAETDEIGKIGKDVGKSLQHLGFLIFKISKKDPKCFLGS